MTTTVSVSLYVEPERLADAFVALMDRMLFQSTVSTALLHRKYWHRQAVEISENQLGTQKRSLVNTIRNSDQALEVQLGYQLLSERRIALDLLLYGAGYEDGLQSEMSGQIQLRLSHNQLAEPLKSLLVQEDKNLMVSQVAQIGAGVLHDAEELFFRACGLQADSPNATFEHAAMYLEAGWPSPAGSSMIFHRKAEDFIKDFARIYAGYHFGIHMPAMLSPDFDVSRSHGKKLEEPKEPFKKNVEFYRQFSKPNADDIFEFLDSLNQEKLRELPMLSEERMRVLLNTVSRNVSDVGCYDFADRGLVLTTNPLSSVWRAYKYVQNEMQ